MLDWLNTEYPSRLRMATRSTKSAPPRYAWTVVTGSSGLIWISPASIDGMTRELFCTLTSSRSSPSSRKMPVSWATQIAAMLLDGAVQFATSRSGVVGTAVAAAVLAAAGAPGALGGPGAPGGDAGAPHAAIRTAPTAPRTRPAQS